MMGISNQKSLSTPASFKNKKQKNQIHNADRVSEVESYKLNSQGFCRLKWEMKLEGLF